MVPVWWPRRQCAFAFRASHRADLRERPAGTSPCLLENGEVLRCVRHVDVDAVYCHESPRAQPCIWCAQLRERDRDPFEEHFKWLLSQSFTCLAECACRRHRPFVPPHAYEPQAAYKATHDLLVAVPEHREAHHEIDDDVRGKQPDSPLPFTGLDENLVHDLSRNHPREHAYRNMVGQAACHRRLVRRMHNPFYRDGPVTEVWRAIRVCTPKIAPKRSIRY